MAPFDKTNAAAAPFTGNVSTIGTLSNKDGTPNKKKNKRKKLSGAQRRRKRKHALESSKLENQQERPKAKQQQQQHQVQQQTKEKEKEQIQDYEHRVAPARDQSPANKHGATTKDQRASNQKGAKKKRESSNNAVINEKHENNAKNELDKKNVAKVTYVEKKNVLKNSNVSTTQKGNEDDDATKHEESASNSEGIEQNSFLSSITASSSASLKANNNLLLQFVYPRCEKSHAIKPYIHTKLRSNEQAEDKDNDDEKEQSSKHSKDGNKEKAKSMGITDDSIEDIFSLPKQQRIPKPLVDYSIQSDDESKHSEANEESAAKEQNYDGYDEVESQMVSDYMDEASSKPNGIQTPENISSDNNSRSGSTTSNSESSSSSSTSSSTATTNSSSSNSCSDGGDDVDGDNDGDKSSKSQSNPKEAEKTNERPNQESLLSQYNEENDILHNPKQSEMIKDISSLQIIKTDSYTVSQKIKESIDMSSSHKKNTNTARVRAMSEDSSCDTMKSHLSGVSIEMAMKDKHGRRPRCNSTDGELNLPRRGLCDEQKVMSFHKWDMDQFRPSPPRGFHNLGNTCFLNATLQCLAHLPTFCQVVANINDGNGSIPNSQQGRLSNGQMITHSLRSLLHRVHGLNGDTAPKQSPISPKNIVNRISLIDGTNRGYKFRPGRQEDAHEFLVHLLDAMNDGELKAAGINQKKSGWRDRLPIPRLDETTFVHRMFGGYLRSQVTCPKCDHKSNTYDPFLDLSLEVSSKRVNSVYSALNEYTRKEKLDADNKWKCSGCNKRVCPTKQLTCFRPPLSLCIQLKRFSFGGDMGGLMHHQYGFSHFAGKGMGMWRGGSKIQKSIEFPADLKLPLSDGRKCEYILTGVVIHVGHSATSGHYTAYIRRQTKTGSQWYHMDDSFVEPVKEKTVLRQRDAYVLFYCRKEVKLNLPKPPAIYSSAEEAIQVDKARQRSKSFEHEIALEEQTQESQPRKQNASDERIEEEDTKLMKENKRHSNQKPGNKKTLTLDQGSKRGAVQVLLRKVKNKKTAWKPARANGNDDETGLLGNTKVSRWDEEEAENERNSSFRDAALKEMKREEQSRKRKMYLNSWDAGLDKGRTKKVKQKNPFDSQHLGPKQNQFHQLQRSRMQTNRKGYNSPFKKKKRKRY